MIMDDAIYKFELADRLIPRGQTSPFQTHNRSSYSVGYSSEIVGRILLTA